MTDEVMACAQCDSSKVTKDTAKSHAGGPNVDGGEYYCHECGERVAIVWRELIGPCAHTDSQSGMARVLADMDPDEVGL